jgi:hypothetical protein
MNYLTTKKIRDLKKNYKTQFILTIRHNLFYPSFTC